MPRRIWRSLDLPTATARPGSGETKQTVDIRETTSLERDFERKALLLGGYYAAMGYNPGVTGVPGRPWDVARAVREGYGRVVWVFRAVEHYASNQARLTVVAHDGPDLIPDHPAALLLNSDKCSQIGESGKIYRKRLSQQVLLSPRGSFTEVVASRAGTPLSYSLLPPNRTRIIPANDGSIQEFVVDPVRLGDKPRHLDPDQVRWTREPHPLDPYAGMTPLEAAGLSIEMDHFARLFNRSFMANDQRPGMVVGIKASDEDSGEIDPREAERIERKFGTGGPLDAGRTVVVDGTVSAVDMGGSPRDGSWLGVSEKGRDEILVAFNLPLSEIGNASEQTFANAASAKESFWMTGQLPHNDTIDDTWGPDRLDPSVNITFDVTDVPALSRFLKERRAEMRIEVAQGLRTIKSYQAMSGPGWYARNDQIDVPGTRVLWLPGGGVPIAGDAGDQQDAAKLTPIGGGGAAPPGAAGGGPGGAGGQPPTPGAPGGTGPAAVPPISRGGITPPGGATDAMLALKAGAAPRERKLRVVGDKVVSDDDEEDHRERDTAAGTLEALLTAIANRLTEVTIAKVTGRQGRLGTRHWQPKAGQPRSTKALNVDAVVDPALWQQQVMAAAMQVLGPAGVAVGNRWRQQLAAANVEVGDTQTAPPAEQPPPSMIPPSVGGAGGGDDAHPVLDYAIIRAIMWLARAAQAKAEDLRDVIHTTEQDELKRLRESGGVFPVDDTTAPIVEAIRRWQVGPDGDTGLSSWAKSRAEAATTATVAGVAHGLLANLPAENVMVTSTWHTRKDDRVRDAHRLAEGQVREAGDPFIVGGEPLAYPGDPAGSPGNVINCRCHTTHSVIVMPETKDLVRTAGGAEQYGVPIGSTIERHRKRTHARPGTLPGNVEAAAWGPERDEALGAAVPFMLGGLGGRDDEGRKPPGMDEPYPHFVNAADAIEAKKQVAADLTARMSDVSDEDLFATFASSTPGAHDIGARYLADARDPQKVWHRDKSSGQWGLADRDHPADAKIYGHVAAGEWDQIPSSAQIGDTSIDLGDPRERYRAGGPEMVAALREQLVARLVHQWAESSNDHNPLSLAIQQVIAEDFALEGYHEWQVDPAWKGMTVRWVEQHRTVLSAFVRAQYDATQERLAQAGIKSLTLYRGFSWPSVTEAPEWAKVRGSADSLTVPLRPAASFSADAGAAVSFAQGAFDGDVTSDEFDQASLLIAGNVPAERILATPRTGVGCLNEWEFVVLGGDGEFSAVGQGFVHGDDPEDQPFSDHELTWMPVSSFTEGEVLRALALNPPDARRRELVARAGDLGMEVKAFDPAKHPHGEHGHWAHAGLTTEDFEGRVGDLTHITRIERGLLPTAALANLPGVKGEVPGGHRNRQDERWQEFLDDVRANGITNPIFITVDPATGPLISEGNHRRDAAVELGLTHVPVHVRYFGHAEHQHGDWHVPKGEVKAAPMSAPAGPSKSDVRNEDWIKTLSWDVRDGEQRPVTDLPTLAAVLGVTEPAARKWLRTMPAGEAAPASLSREGKGAMDELEGKAAMTDAEHAAWTAAEQAKHPRGVHGRFAHSWMRTMHTASQRDPHHVITDVLTPTGLPKADEPAITWNKHQDGYVSADGRFYIERRISGARLYEQVPASDPNAEPIEGGPFSHGRVVSTGTVAQLRTLAEQEPARGVNSVSNQGGSDEPLRGDSGGQLAAGSAGPLRADHGQADVLPRAGGGSAAAGGRDDGRGTGPDRGRDIPRQGEPDERGAGDGGRDRGPGVADTAATADGNAGPDERDPAAGGGEPGGRGVEVGPDGLPRRGYRVADVAAGSGTDAGVDDGIVTGADQPAPDPSQMPGAVGGEDFRPTGIDDLSPAGKIAKLNANMAALRLLRELRAEKRPATPEEQQVLARWAGWGNLSEVFDPDKPRFAAARAELDRLMSPAEIREARKNTLNAHYTDARVVEQIWRAVGELGFDGGRVLEPGSGSGTFIGMAPDHAAMVGVELDSTTAAISQYLYPSAVIRNEGFEDTNVPDGAFDATVGNVPFGKFELVDRRHNPTGESIHNHFILKSLALTRPGGIVAVLTSRYTLDSQSDRARRLMADKADLIGAIRLPTGSHERASGTSVIEDILIFRVREPGEAPQEDQSWVTAHKQDINGYKLPISDYWAEHPDNVLGELTAEGGQFHTGSILVRGDRDMADLPAVIDRVVADAKAKGLTATPRDTTTDLPELIGPDRSRHEGHIRAEDDGTFTQAVRGASRPFAVPDKQAAELRGLIGLRDTLAALLTAEAATAEDTPQIATLRDLLNARYDAYVSEFGPINRFKLSKSGARNRPRQGNFRNDPMSAVVRALEKFDPVTQTADKADVFTKRAVAPRELRTTADNPRDALTLSMETYGEVDLPAIAKMLGTDEGTARERLGTLVFEQPPLTDEEQAAAEQAATLMRLGDIDAADEVNLESVGESIRDAGTLEPAVAYLSGNVRKKLAAAKAAAAHDPRFQANVDALQQVIPADLGPDEIDGRLGASWIGPDVIEAFLRDILREPQHSYNPNKKVQVAHSGGSIWTVVAPRKGTLATQEWGTPDRPAPALVAALLEQRSIKVTRTIIDAEGNEREVPDLEATLAAQAKAQQIQDRFAEWIWEDPDRARRLAATYNDRFNAIVLRKYQADPNREWPGMAASWKPYEHVKSAAERIVQEPTVLLAHVVGAGKTSEMTMGAMELRRLGLARKPAIVIPNHMLEQFSREYLEIYPQAKILAAGTEDLKGENRREFVARAATGDWDTVILTQSAFEAIPMSREAQQAYIDREMATMRAQLEQAKASGGEEGSNAQKRTVKKMETALQRAETALKKKLDKQKDVGVSFEQTGIDYLMVDEAHMYSNLRTLSNIQSADIEGSDRATDLHMKIEHLRANSTSGRVATFATGTPIRNTVTQTYVMQKFLRPDLLEEAGIHSFDQWAATFGEVVSEMELKPEGMGFRQTERFARFRNVPELLRLFHTMADVKMAEDLNLPTPNLVGGKTETVVVPASDELRAYVSDLGDRAEAVRDRKVDPTEDNMLKISGDGRKAALSMALVGQEHQPGKIEMAADRIASIHEANKDNVYGNDPIPGAMQIVFLDMGTPKNAGKTSSDAEDAPRTMDDNDTDFDAYAKLKAELVARGMEPDSIRFIHEAKNDAQKAEMFAAAKNGRISVLIGSSEKMGVGTNIQKRAVALHHLDAPWRPADVEQRDGRIFRGGNMNADVQIIRYVTEHSFDAYMWQTLERKAKFIHQVMRGNLDVREIEDVGDTALNAAEAKALAAGDPSLLERAKADDALTKLERLERAHARAQTNMRADRARHEDAIPSWDADAAALDAAIAQRQDTHGDKFAMTVNGEPFATRTEAAPALIEALQAATRQGYRGEPVIVGRLGGHDITLTNGGYDYRGGGYKLRVGFAGVPGDAFEVTPHQLGEMGPGIVSRLETALRGFEAKRDRLREAVATAQNEVGMINERLGKPFPRADELAQVRARAAVLKERMLRAQQRAEGHDVPWDESIDGPEPPNRAA